MSQPNRHGVIGTDPWLLWGSTQVGQIIGDGGLPPTQTLQQIVNVDYHYPVEWGFWLQVDASTNAQVPLLSGVIVDFRMQLGVGRSNALAFPFAEFNFEPADLAGGSAQRFCTSVQVIPPSASFPTNPSQPLFIDKFPAQSIQIAAIVRAGPQAVGHVTTLSCTAYVAPVSHVRPQWYAGDFGSELGGR